MGSKGEYAITSMRKVKKQGKYLTNHPDHFPLITFVRATRIMAKVTHTNKSRNMAYAEALGYEIKLRYDMRFD